MSRIDISAEELDTIPYGTLQNRLSQADDWSNFKTLYLATNSLHVKMYFLEKGATALRSKSSTAATKLANQLKSAGFTLTYDSSGKVQEIIPPASTGPLFVDYNPFVITDTGDITNPDDDLTNVTLREALSRDPIYIQNDAILKTKMNITLASPLVISKDTFIDFNSKTDNEGCTLNGDITIDSGNVSILGVNVNGNVTIASGGKLRLGEGSSRYSVTYSGTLTGGTLDIRNPVTITGDVHGLERLSIKGNSIAKGEGGSLDLSGTVVEIESYTPTYSTKKKQWERLTMLNTGGFDFSSASSLEVLTLPALSKKDFNVGKKYFFFDARHTADLDAPRLGAFELIQHADSLDFDLMTDYQDTAYVEKQAVTRGHMSLDDAFESGFTKIAFSDSLTDGLATYSDGMRAYVDSTIQGNGADGTTISGERFFATANSLQYKDLSYEGTIFGGRNPVEKAPGSANDNASLAFDGVTFLEGSRIYGGGNSETAASTLQQGTVSVALGDSYVGSGVSIYGAGNVNASNAKIESGSITLDISSTNTDSRSGNIYAGGYIGANGGDVSISGTVSTTISGGHFNYTGNGTRTTVGSTSEQGESTLRISGGTFDGPVYAGGYTMGGEATVNGDTLLEISGGTFTKEVYGGCGANKARLGSLTVLDGSANTRIVCGENAITFKGSVFAGSYGAGTIRGNNGTGTTLTFTGDGDCISWGGGASIYGCCQLTRGSITGSRELIFDAFTNSAKSFGALDAKNGFDTVTAINGSNVTFDRPALLSNVSQWNLEAGSTISWEASDIDGSPCLAENDFAGDAINVSGLGNSMQDCTLLSGCSIINWGDASVSFNGGSICSCVDGSYTDGNYRLWLDGSSVKVGMLAA